MRGHPIRLVGPVLIEPVVHGDARGFFQETYRRGMRESGFAYDDDEVGIAWPAGIPLAASPRDSAAPALRDLGLVPTAR